MGNDKQSLNIAVKTLAQMIIKRTGWNYRKYIDYVQNVSLVNFREQFKNNKNVNEMSRKMLEDFEETYKVLFREQFDQDEEKFDPIEIKEKKK